MSDEKQQQFVLYTGAGVLIFDPRRSAFLLVHDYTMTFNCAGGFIKYDSHVENYLEKTASEELAEETRQLIRCSPDDLRRCPFVDISLNGRLEFCAFRCYLLRCECPADICEQFERIDVSTLPLDGEFHETNALKYFPVEQFFDAKTKSQIEQNATALDEFGEERSLHRRAINVIRTMEKFFLGERDA